MLLFHIVYGGVSGLYSCNDVPGKAMHRAVSYRRVIIIIKPKTVVMYQRHVLIHVYRLYTGHHSSVTMNSSLPDRLGPRHVLGSVCEGINLGLSLCLGQGNQTTVHSRAWDLLVTRPVGAEERAPDEVGTREGRSYLLRSSSYLVPVR